MIDYIEDTRQVDPRSATISGDFLPNPFKEQLTKGQTRHDIMLFTTPVKQRSGIAISIKGKSDKLVGCFPQIQEYRPEFAKLIQDKKIREISGIISIYQHHRDKTWYVNVHGELGVIMRITHPKMRDQTFISDETYNIIADIFSGKDRYFAVGHPT